MVGNNIEISLDRLLLDESNFRIDEVDHQLAAIKEIIKQQDNGAKIFNLAKHISEKGQLAPGERLLEHVSKPVLQSIKADQRASDQGQRIVDIDSALISCDQPPEAAQP